VEISFDSAKNERNIALRISFERAAEFGWASAWIRHDIRKDYGEQRYRALGLIDGRLHMLGYTPRGQRVHVISLRKANEREVRKYEAQARSRND